MESPVAVCVTEMDKWGCPKCGYRSGYKFIQDGSTTLWQCGSCSVSCLVLAVGITESTLGVNGNKYPKLQDHPRAGIPKHGTEDQKPEEGEYFNSRGIGLDHVEHCFVCGKDTKHEFVSNIAGFVKCKDSGERVVKMFGGWARLDYRDIEPDRVQVKIGVCPPHKRADGTLLDKGHMPELEKLEELIHDGIITSEKIAIARGNLE